MTIDEQVAEQIIAVGQNTPNVYENGKRQGKSEGKAEGYTEGYIKGNTDGYESGYTDGETEGYGDGYSYGYENGYRDGGSEGYNTGVADGIEQGRAEGLEQGRDEGIEQGKQAEREAFWNSFQQNGTRENYNRAFGGKGWNDDTLKPPYAIRPRGNNNAYMLFSNCGIVDAFRKNSIELDTSGATGDAKELFANCGSLIYIPPLDLSNCLGMQSAFAYCYWLVTIEKLVISENTTPNGTFSGCRSLENIVIEGTIGKNGWDMKDSTNLSRASITSIMAALSTTTTGLTVTFSLAAVNKAFETAEGANDGSTSPAWEAQKNTRTNWGIGLA